MGAIARDILFFPSSPRHFYKTKSAQFHGKKNQTCTFIFTEHENQIPPA